MTSKFYEFFLAIESDLTKTSRFVEFNEENFKTYSVEFARILLSASSEVDVQCKELCSVIDPNKCYSNIQDYRKCITSKCPTFHTIEVLIPRYGLERKPWEKWASNSTENPSWWKSYNDVKHHRVQYFKQANLKNAIDSVAGLFSLVVFLRKAVKDETWFSTVPQILDLKKKKDAGAWGRDWDLSEYFPDSWQPSWDPWNAGAPPPGIYTS